MNRMTLEDAIRHCKAIAEVDCTECGQEHRQLAEWLEELVWYRDKQTERVYCKKCKYNNGKSCEWHGTPIVVDGWCSHGRMGGGEVDG